MCKSTVVILVVVAAVVVVAVVVVVIVVVAVVVVVVVVVAAVVIVIVAGDVSCVSVHLKITGHDRNCVTASIKSPLSVVSVCCFSCKLRPVWITFECYNFSVAAVFAVIHSKTMVNGQLSLLKTD